MLQLNINVIRSSTNLAIDTYSGRWCWYMYVCWNVRVSYLNFRCKSLSSCRHFLFQLLVECIDLQAILLHIYNEESPVPYVIHSTYTNVLAAPSTLQSGRNLHPAHITCCTEWLASPVP